MPCGSHDQDARLDVLAHLGAVPVVLAFAADWLPPSEDAEESLDVVRAQLRGLGATLVVLSNDGIWSFRPDDDVERFAPASPEVAAAIAELALRYRVERTVLSGPTVVVLDADRGVRFQRAGAGTTGTLGSTLVEALEVAGRALAEARMPPAGFTRREWIVACLVSGFALALGEGCSPSAAGRARPPASNVRREMPADDSGELNVVLDVNGSSRTLRIDPRVSLLDALRERVGLTGTKKGCDHGQCGACTVLVEGRRVCSCLMLAVMAQGAQIRTIEGLARGEALHPVQAAFVAEDGLQCGYCTPGQIMSAVALLAEGHATTDDEVREQMSGNICRCGAYPNIVAAIQLARKAG
jgi:xanthine dehydrogenase YagT iron-sulfur-binding subunit